MKQGVIFFGHGARDIRWKEPFDQIITLWKTNYPNIPAELAFLEMMTPNLLNTVTLLANQQISSITCWTYPAGQWNVTDAIARCAQYVAIHFGKQLVTQSS
jgi:sirohydrochlorin ferrochelatase